MAAWARLHGHTRPHTLATGGYFVVSAIIVVVSTNDLGQPGKDWILLVYSI